MLVQQRAVKLCLLLNRQSSHRLLGEELEIEKALNAAILEGIRQPLLRLDSVGFIIVSGRALITSKSVTNDQRPMTNDQ